MTKKEFGMRLATLRTNRDISARLLSKRVGHGHTYIARIETGEFYPKLETFFKICKILHVTPEEFYQTNSLHPDKIKTLLPYLEQLSAVQLDNILQLRKALV